jgi:hypothetical protein
MQKPPERLRDGQWSASGQYLWFGFSDGLDEFKDKHPNLDMRRKVSRTALPIHHSIFSLCCNFMLSDLSRHTWEQFKMGVSGSISCCWGN